MNTQPTHIGNAEQRQTKQLLFVESLPEVIGPNLPNINVYTVAGSTVIMLHCKIHKPLLLFQRLKLIKERRHEGHTYLPLPYTQCYNDVIISSIQWRRNRSTQSGFGHYTF